MAGDTKTTVVDKDGNAIIVDGKPVSNDQAYEASSVAHDDAQSDVFPPFDQSTYGPQLFWLALSFGVLYLLMSKVALPKIGEILEVRRDRIEGDLAEAERLRQKTDQAISSYEAELAKSKAKAHEIAEDTRTTIKDELAEKRSEVEADLTKKLSIAEARIQKTKSDALLNVDEIATDTVIELVTKLNTKVSAKLASDAVAKILKG